MILRKHLTKKTVKALKPAAERYDVLDDTTDGFMVRVSPSGIKTFYVYYRIAGRRRRPSLGIYNDDTLKVEKARAEAIRYISEAKLGRDLSAERQASRKANTFEEYSEDYMTEAKKNLKPKSIEEYQRSLDLYLLPEFGKNKLTSILQGDVSRLHRRLSVKKTVECEPKNSETKYKRETGGPFTANRALALLKVMFQTAETWGLIPKGSNPAVGIKMLPEKPRERYLTPDELARLADSIEWAEREKKATPWAVAAIRLLMFTGARLSEILTLRWEYVDEEARCLRLPDSKSGAKVVHLNVAALEVLTNLASHRVKGNPFAIVGHKHGERLINAAKPWRRIRENAKLPDLRIHDLRHVYAGMGASLGLGLPVVGKLLGHSQPRTTARYANLAPDPVAAANERIGEALVAAMAKGKAKVIDATGGAIPTPNAESKSEPRTA